MYARAVMGNATDANGGSFAMKLSRRIKGKAVVAVAAAVVVVAADVEG